MHFLMLFGFFIVLLSSSGRSRLSRRSVSRYLIFHCSPAPGNTKQDAILPAVSKHTEPCGIRQSQLSHLAHALTRLFRNCCCLCLVAVRVIKCLTLAIKSSGIMRYLAGLPSGRVHKILFNLTSSHSYSCPCSYSCSYPYQPLHQMNRVMHKKPRRLLSSVVEEGLKHY